MDLTPTLKLMIALAETYPLAAAKIIEAIEEEMRELVEESRPSGEIAMYRDAVMEVKKQTTLFIPTAPPNGVSLAAGGRSTQHR